MKVLGLKSVVSFGTSSYRVSKITNKELSLENIGSKKVTNFALSDILENLNLGTLKVEKI